MTPLSRRLRRIGLMSTRTRLVCILACLLTLALAARALGLDRWFSPALLQSQVREHLALGVLVFVLLFAAGNLMQVPGWVFSSSAVLALGPWWGALLTYVGANLACLSSYLVIRHVGAGGLRALEGRYTQRLFHRLDTRPLQSVTVLRLMFQTVPPLNAALAMSGVPTRPYILGTLIGLPVPILVHSWLWGAVAVWLGWPVGHG